MIEIILIVLGAVLLIIQLFVREKSKSSIIIALLIIILAAILQTISHFDEIENNKKTTLNGILESNLIDSTNPIIFKIGSTSIGESFETVNNIDYYPLWTIGIDNYPLTLNISNNKLQISGEFYSSDQKVVAIIKNNEWVINQNNYFQRNFNKTAIEIIDNYNIPIIQIQIESSNVISLKTGIIFYDDSFGKNVAIINNGVTITTYNPNEDYKKYFKNTKLMFLYPSELHQGETNS